jgi:hypothetical protein
MNVFIETGTDGELNNITNDTTALIATGTDCELNHISNDANVFTENGTDGEMKHTGCVRKKNPNWEGHSFGCGARTVVGSTSSNSGVRAVFSVHHGIFGRTSSFYC